MQHFLYFFPLPQGQGSFLPTFCVWFSSSVSSITDKSWLKILVSFKTLVEENACSPDLYSFISSSLIKEVLAFDADVKNLVPKQVLIALKNKSKGR